jgi:hypothetical protein
MQVNESIGKEKKNTKQKKINDALSKKKIKF